MAAWVREGGKMAENRQRKKEAEDAGKIEVAYSLRRPRATLIGPIQGLRKRRRLRR